MTENNYIVEGLFILLGVLLIVTVLKYPKDIFVKTPIAIVRHIFESLISYILSPFVLVAIPLSYLGEKYNWKITPTIKKFIGWDLSNDKEDMPYPTTKNLKVEFQNGDKYICVIRSKKDLKELINDLIDTLTKQYSIDEFKISETNDNKIISFPKNINFYDYHLLVQHFTTELGDKNSFGLFKSDNLNYYVFQDTKTLNNLVGFTADKKRFSIYMLDDLDKKQHLRLNQKIKLDTDWIEQLNGTPANTRFA